MAVKADHSGPEREAALLSWIQQSAPYGVATLDGSFQVQSWNHWMELHSGKRFADVVGKDLFTLYPDLHVRRLTGYFERALKGESSVLSTSLHRYLLPLPPSFRETGLDLMLQTARIAPLFSGGAVCGIVLEIEDVTQRESQAEALTRQHRRDELLSWALAHLLKTDEPRKAVRQLFFKIAEQLDFDTFLVYLRDIESDELHLEAVGGIPAESEKDFLVCPLPELVDGGTHEPIVLNSVQSLAEAQYGAMRTAGLRAAIATPLLANDKNLGLLCFASASRDSIQSEETDLVNTIAQYLAIALDRENANLQLRKVQNQLRDHAQLLEARVTERTVRLQETISELETFSYTIAHDLRAPARAVSGYCDLLLDDFKEGLSPEAERFVQRIGRASSRMESLTRDLLEFSRISRQEIVLAPVQLELIIDDISTVRGNSVNEALTVCKPLHPVRAHQGLLQHVFLNLVDNAVKFVQPGVAPKITISTEVVEDGSPSTRGRPLTFSSARVLPQSEPSSRAGGGARGARSAEKESSSNHIRIWVRDEGIGIPREAHEKIFGIFERALPAGSYEGTGMGLAIVARAVQRMGGTCGVESELGKGSSFWLELPAA